MSTTTVTASVTYTAVLGLSVTNTFPVIVNEVNLAPVLTVPADQTINEQTTLNVSASAIDADIPANSLTFALVSAPTGMTINPASGAISWTPTEAQGPSTNAVSEIGRAKCREGVKMSVTAAALEKKGDLEPV